MSSSHLDSKGGVHMIDVGDKPERRRVATASARLRVTGEQMCALSEGSVRKGDWRTTAQIAGIQGAKRASDWIPLCHPIPLEHVDVGIVRVDEDNRIELTCTVCATAKTGVEMEARSGVCAAALAIYDMIKAIDKGAEIERVRLEHKSGGRSGDWKRSS